MVVHPNKSHVAIFESKNPEVKLKMSIIKINNINFSLADNDKKVA